MHPRQDEIRRYFNDNADFTHRLNYDLNENSLVFDLGGYDGTYALRLYERYKCNIMIFEPIKKFYDNILKRTKHLEKINVYNFGLGAEDIFLPICVDGDASSLYSDGPNKEIIQIENILSFFEKNNIKNIDLFKVNIEGAEYELFDFMIKKNLHHLCKDIQVQFHPQFDQADDRGKIQNIFTKSHHLTYNYEYVFENWRINKRKF